MPGYVIGNTLGRGFSGNITRDIDAIVEPLRNLDTNAISFGSPVVLKSTGDGALNWAAANAADDFMGVAVRTVKTNTAYGSNTAQYEVDDIVDVLTRGSINVKCVVDATATSKPVKGASVYIRKASGVFVAAAEGSSGANTVLLTGVKWAQNGCDSDGTAEIVILDRKS